MEGNGAGWETPIHLTWCSVVRCSENHFWAAAHFFLSLQIRQSFVKAVSSLSNWMILNKSFTSVESHFPHLQNEDYNNSYFHIRMLEVQNDISL